MAENRVQIVISTDASGAVSGIRLVSAELGRLGSSGTNSIQGISGGIASMTSGLSAALRVMQGLSVAWAAFKAAETGIGFNREIEDSRLGIAALLSAQGEFLDAQGRELEGRQKINAAMSYAGEITRRLQKDNIQTAATYQQLIRAFQATLSPGMSEGLSVDQVRQYTVAMVQAAAAMQVPLDMMAEETRSLLKGTITPKNTLIASALGITPDAIHKLQGDADALFSYVMGKLQSFTAFGEMTQTTFTGLFSNTKDAIANALGQATQPFFDAAKNALKEFIDYAIRVDSVTGQMTLNPELIRSFELLNDTMLAALGLAKGLAEALRIVGSAYSAIKDAAERYSKTIVVGQPDDIGQFTPTNEERLMRVKQLMADIVRQKELLEKSRETSWFRSATEDVNLLTVAMAKIGLATDTAALEYFRSQMAAAGQDTTELDAFLRALKGASDEVAAAQDAAAGSVGNFGYQAAKAAMDLDTFKNKLQEVARINLSGLEDDLTKSIESLNTKIKVAIQGGDAGQQAMMSRYEERIRKLASAWVLAIKVGAAPEVFANLSARRDQIEEELSKTQKLEELNNVRRQSAAKSGPAPVGLIAINRELDQMVQKSAEAAKALQDLQYERAIIQREAEGRTGEAEWLKAEKAMLDQTSDAWKDISEAQTRYRETYEKLSAARGGATAEALSELAQAKAYLDEIWAKGLERLDLIPRVETDRFALSERDRLLSGEVDLAQANLEYAELTGSIQDQYEAKLLLIQATKAEKLANTSLDIPGLREAYARLYDEQERLLRLQSEGSFFEGLIEGLRRFKNELPGAFQTGINVFDSIKRGIDSAADALAEFTLTGKMEFADFANSIIKDLIRMMYQAMLTQMVSGLLNIFGIGGGSAGGSPSWNPVVNIGNIWDGVKGKASGGPVYPGETYLVGERGPEILRMGSRAGTVIPMGASSGEARVTTHITVNVSGGQAGSSERAADHQKMGREIAAVVKAEFNRNLQEQTRPGGLLNRGLGR